MIPLVFPVVRHAGGIGDRGHDGTGGGPLPRRLDLAHRGVEDGAGMAHERVLHRLAHQRRLRGGRPPPLGGRSDTIGLRGISRRRRVDHEAVADGAAGTCLEGTGHLGGHLGPPQERGGRSRRGGQRDLEQAVPPATPCGQGGEVGRQAGERLAGPLPEAEWISGQIGRHQIWRHQTGQVSRRVDRRHVR
jgi:hypothetical protein